MAIAREGMTVAGLAQAVDGLKLHRVHYLKERGSLPEFAERIYRGSRHSERLHKTQQLNTSRALLPDHGHWPLGQVSSMAISACDAHDTTLAVMNAFVGAFDALVLFVSLPVSSRSMDKTSWPVGFRRQATNRHSGAQLSGRHHVPEVVAHSADSTGCSLWGLGWGGDRS